MKTPGFNAENSLLQTNVSYKTHEGHLFSQLGEIIPSYAVPRPRFSRSTAYCETVCMGNVLWCICDDGFGNQHAEPCGSCAGGGYMA